MAVDSRRNLPLLSSAQESICIKRLDIPIIERLRRGWNKTGRLGGGDGKMSALDTRAYLARPQDWDVSPGPLPGTTAEAMDAWSTAGVTPGEAGE